MADDQNIAPIPSNLPENTPEPPPDSIPRPATQSLAKVGEYFAPGAPLTAADMAGVLSMDLTYDSSNETLLFEQTRVLDTLFHRLIAQSFGNTHWRTGEYDCTSVDDSRIKLALQAQKLCRQTACALHIIRQPHTIAPPTGTPRK
jgi:hypothetical protein